jgi:nicotinate-nucleotide adenylyltransferase
VKRIGLFGGSFDPVHTGHLALARAAVQALGLDELHWIPAGRPWQKDRRLAGAEHRAEMVALAIAGEPRFTLDRSELDRDGVSYTLHTVRLLQEATPDAQWFLLIGADQYANLHTWHGWQDLLRRVTLVVAARNGQAPAPDAVLAHVPHHVHIVPMPPVPASSTDIRERRARGESAASMVPHLLPAAVADYLDRHELYAPPAKD